MFKKCRVGLCLSSWLALPVFLLECSLAVALIVKQDAFFTYLDDNQEELHLDDDTISTLHSWSTFMMIGLFVLGGLQLVRFLMSKKLRKFMQLSNAEFEGMLAQEEAEFTNRRYESQANTRTKYNDLRAKYREKYGNIPGVGTETLLDNSDV